MRIRFCSLIALAVVASMSTGCTYKRTFLRTAGGSIPEIDAMITEELTAAGYVDFRHKDKGRSEIKERVTSAENPGEAEDGGASAKFEYRLRRDGVDVKMRIRGSSKDTAQLYGYDLGLRIEERLRGFTLAQAGSAPVRPPVDLRVGDRPVRPARTGPLAQDSGVKHCLVIGISKYRGDFEDLTAARRDAERIKLEFEKQGVPSDYMHFLFDNDAQEAAIIEKLVTISNQANKGDTIIVYFAGHGKAPTKDDRYLVPYDGRKDSPTSSMIDIDHIEKVLDESQAERQLLLLDCCFAEPDTRASVADDAFRPLEGRGRVVITSTKGSERALDRGKNGTYSPFASAVIDVFSGKVSADEDNDTVVTADELHRAIKGRVYDEAKNAGLFMTPQIYGDSAKEVRFINAPRPGG